MRETLGLDRDLKKLLYSSIRDPYGFKFGLPYHSVFYQGQELMIGRRRDTLARHTGVLPEDIQGRAVLDLGTNLGAAAILAAEAGAEVLGVDKNPRLIAAARRLALLLGVDVRYEAADVERMIGPPAHTIFAFALFAHVPDREALWKTLSTAEVVYIEDNWHHPQFPSLAAGRFTSVASVRGGDRPMFRCIP